MENTTKTVSVTVLTYYVIIAWMISITLLAVVPYVIGTILEEFGVILW